MLRTSVGLTLATGAHLGQFVYGEVQIFLYVPAGITRVIVYWHVFSFGQGPLRIRPAIRVERWIARCSL